MAKPLLLIISGRPASGKTTLAGILSKEIKCPLLSRDGFKEGYLFNNVITPNEAVTSTNVLVNHTFFKATELLISQNISVVIEAAFQHRLWQQQLTNFLDKADVRIIICYIKPASAIARFNNRILNDPGRQKYHDDINIEAGKGETASLIENYIPVPTLTVNTENSYKPGIKELLDFITC